MTTEPTIRFGSPARATHAPVADVVAAGAPVVPPVPLPDVPGHRLHRLLGRGGMGAVYEGEQFDPPRRVAVKLITAPLTDADAVARFAVERQAVARLDHPGVARVFDAGTTADGRPYFAMELVDGVPLTDFCQSRNLPLRQRLGLFVAVCRAVQHAHQKGVIHRDLKPGNILVTEADGPATPKVIDFGLAKLVADGDPRVTTTAAGAVAGTPLYMAPEQATPFARPEIDTRTDVYGLGVILFELLVGRPPLTADDLAGLNPVQLLVRVRESVAPRPSAMADPARTATLRGELDWIVLKCLEKEPDRRYPTADQLADDVDRYLADQPVTARPPSRWYAARKFVKRNRKPAAAAAVMLALLVAGVVSTAWGLVRAERLRVLAEERAEEAAAARTRETAQRRLTEANATRAADAEADTAAFLRFVSAHVFAAARPKEVDGGLGQDVTLRDALAAAEGHIPRGFRGRPLAEALARLEIGRTWRHLGDTKRAIGHLGRAVELRTRHLGREHEETVQAVNELATACQADGDTERAAALFAEQAAAAEARLGPTHLTTLTLWGNWGLAEWAAGRAESAVRRFEPTLAALEAGHGADHPQTITTRNNLATAYLSAGRYQDARREYERTVRDRDRTVGDGHPDADTARANLAVVYQELRRHADAVALIEPLLPRAVVRYGDTHPATLRLRINAALSYQSLGQSARAIALLEQNRAAYAAAGRGRDPAALTNANNLAVAYAAAGDYARALPLHRDTLAGRRSVLGDAHPDTLNSANNLGHALWQSGDPTAARPHLQAAFDGRRAVHGPDHPRTLAAQGNLASVSLSLGRKAVARALADDLRERAARAFSPGHPERLESERVWIACREDAGEWAAAADARAALLTAERAATSAGHPRLASALVLLGMAQLRCERFAAAEASLREALAIREKAGPTAWTTANARSLLGEALLARRAYADAGPLLQAGYEGLTVAPIPPSIRRDRLDEALARLVRHARATGDRDALTKWLAARAQLPKELLPPPRPVE